MNFELSLPLIWLVMFDILGFTMLIFIIRRRICQSKSPKSALRDKLTSSAKSQSATLAQRPSQPSPKATIFFQFPGLSDRRFFILSWFPLYLTLSVLWSSNPLRGLLTAGVAWAIFIAVFILIYVLPLCDPPHDLRRTVLRVLFLSSIVICLFCFVQSILDVIGLDRENTLLCAGCTVWSFGFPHPSGFAIEPQFMGNLLLAPTLTALYLLAFRTPSDKRSLFGLIVTALFISITLFFTFSRGAIYAYAVALLALIGFALYRKKFRWSLLAIPAVSFVLALGAQGILAEFGPTSETFVSGITKSIHQLSLGVIDLRQLANRYETTYPVENSLSVISEIDSETAENDAYFAGYVAESTNIRLNLNKVAVQTWLSSPQNIIFGVGLGGAGTAMHTKYPEIVTSPKEIVQHQGFSLLLETGLVGIAVLMLDLLICFSPQLFSSRFLDGRHTEIAVKNTFWQHPALPLLISLIVAYLITLNFFSGLPNALQIYLMPPLLYYVFLNTF